MSIWFSIGLICLLGASFLIFALKDESKKLKVFVIILSVFLPICAVLIYISIGNPHITQAPLAERQTEVMIASMVSRAEERMKQNPDDARGYEVLAPVYTRLERFDDLVKVRRNLLRLQGANNDTQSNLAESLILQAKGRVTFESMQLYQMVLTRDKNHLQAAYYLAIAKEQAGEKQEALASLKSLYDKTKAVPEKEFLRQEIERLSK
jgi:cytochrome c-type biogenesis protein CcmH